MAVSHPTHLDEPPSAVRPQRAPTVIARSETAPGRRAARARTHARHERDVASLEADSFPEALIGVPFN